MNREEKKYLMQRIDTEYQRKLKSINDVVATELSKFDKLTQLRK